MSTLLRNGEKAAKMAIAGEQATALDMHRRRMAELHHCLEQRCTCGHKRQRHTLEGPVQAMQEPCYVRGCGCRDFAHADPQ